VGLEGFIALQVHQNGSATPLRVRFRNLRIQELGLSTWSRLRPGRQVSGDVTLRMQFRGSELLLFRYLRVNGEGTLMGLAFAPIARAEPQAGVKPILPREGKVVTLSSHDGRRAAPATGPLTFPGRVEVLSSPGGAP
jgi:hypothetical protein